MVKVGASSDTAISKPRQGTDENHDESFPNDGPLEESQNTDTQTQTQMEFTQLTQPGLTPDESTNLMSASASSNHTPLSQPLILPFGRLVPCVPSANLTAIDLMPTQDSYWLGRSQKCDVTAQYVSDEVNELSKKESAALEWGKSMISNRHCRIFQQNNGNQIFIEDNSGNGTFINQQTKLGKGETRILHSGDEICLINTETLRKKISSDRVIQMVLQQFSFIIVQSKPRKSCVNPRAMNYNFGRNRRNGIEETKSSPLPPSSPIRRIETFYDMREILGDGTSGQVRRAIHRQTGKERAVKIISLRRNIDVSMMEREVNLLQSLDHPYIVKLMEVFVQRGVAMYLVMELVEGGDLFDSIVDKQLYTEVEARRAMRRLLSAVYYLHEEANVVHRDLKPENILCSSPTHVKLADFGLAKIMKADGLKTFCGTPAYFAPEVLQRRGTVAGRGRYGKPADMWSIGVILYILLTGKPPFGADIDESSSECYEVDFVSDAHIWSKISPAKDLVEKFLRHDPKRRLTVRQACDHTWINVEDGDTHRNPLDDPVVVTKKIVEKQESKGCDQVYESVGNESTKVECDQSRSVCSKDIDTVSKEEFAVCSKDIDPVSKEDSTAAVSSHYQGNNILPDEDKTLSKPTTTDVNDASATQGAKTAALHLSDRDEGKCGHAKRQCNDRNDGMMKPKIPDDNTTIKNEQSNGLSCSANVCLPPRSPFTKLNVNQRSNKFRDKIMKQTNDPCESPNGSEEQQTAVTPNSSNVTRHPEQKDLEAEGDDGNVEDPILSQFSSDQSSVESFSDNDDSANETSKADQLQSERSPKKRPLDEKKASKRAKTCSSKQTTLNSWLVKKDR
mmetsp:Transcript_9566/g.20697  ORF Transcript_9566/g.20697 Transcript_9566/m.20697 type:complete len:847 (-) Transcript_9566:284-2824(-)